MFDGKITAKNLIEQIKEEADIAISIPDTIYITWLNSVEQLLYAELIHEQGGIEITGASENVIDVSSLTVRSGEDTVRFEDIHAVYADNIQLIKSTLASGVIFPNTYYKVQNNIGLNLKNKPQTIKFIYFVRPKIKTKENYGELPVNLPPEFLEIIKAKLRGEAYKLANEDSLAAKWINDYNVLLETFKMWLEEKRAVFGT